MEKHEIDLSMKYFLDNVLPVYMKDRLSEKQIECSINFYSENTAITNEDIAFYLDNCKELDLRFNKWVESQTLTPRQCVEMNMMRNLLYRNK